MSNRDNQGISSQIIEKAKKYGACLAGVTSVDALKTSPSHAIHGRLGDYGGVGTIETDSKKQGKIIWPEGAESAIIVAVEHPEDKPELDWWQDGLRGGTPGNHILISINHQLAEWLQAEKGIQTKKLPYHIERGGVFLKDGAVMAGLGCTGKNNLLVTPEFGPRIRLRAILTYETLPNTGSLDFDPCQDCSMPCREVCPQEAFAGKIYSRGEFGLDRLPGRSGVYSRNLCNIQMESDVAQAQSMKDAGRNEAGRLVKYCRNCELACPVGKAL